MIQSQQDYTLLTGELVDFFFLFELRQNDNQFVWIHSNKHRFVFLLINEMTQQSTRPAENKAQ